MPTVKNDHLPTTEERDRIHEFVIAFNRIDKELRKRLRLHKHIPFPQVLVKFDTKYVHDLDIAFLKNAASLPRLLQIKL